MTDKTLREAATMALDALEYHTEQTRPIERTAIAIEALRASLALPDEPEDFDAWSKNPYTVVLEKSIAEDYMPRHAAPQTATVGQKPLTDDEIDSIWRKTLVVGMLPVERATRTTRAFACAIEAAHGIQGAA